MKFDKENFYKYLLFFKKFPDRNRFFLTKDGLYVNPAIEIILYAEKYVKSLKSGKPLRINAIKEKDYYDYYSLKETFNEYYKEFESLPVPVRRRIERFSDTFPFENFNSLSSKVNESKFFYALINNQINEKQIKSLLKHFFEPNAIGKTLQRMSYSLFKSFFLLKNEEIEKIFLFFLKNIFDFYFPAKEKNLSEGNYFSYFFKYLFHVKNQALNIRFNLEKIPQRLKNAFNLNLASFRKEEKYLRLPISKDSPNIFFHLNSWPVTLESKLAPVIFFMQRYYYTGAENLNSIFYTLYFPESEVAKMFPREKIKKDYLNFIRFALGKENLSKEEVLLFIKDIKDKYVNYLGKLISNNLFKEAAYNLFPDDIFKDKIKIPDIEEKIEVKARNLENFSKKFFQLNSNSPFRMPSIALLTEKSEKEFNILTECSNIQSFILIEEQLSLSKERKKEKNIEKNR